MKSLTNTEAASAEQSQERGATMVEYVLLAALIAVVCIAAVTFLGNQASAKFSTVGSTLQASPTN